MKDFELSSLPVYGAGEKAYESAYFKVHEAVEQLAGVVKRQREELFQKDTLEWLSANSLGLNPSLLALPRYVPTEIYVQTAEGQNRENAEVADAFRHLLKAAGFDSYDETLPEFGSMRWRRTYRTKRRQTAKELDERLTLVQLALIRAFKAEGISVNTQAEDREALARAEETHRAELRKIEAEIEQAKAEADKARAETAQARADTTKAKAEGLKALAEASEKFVKVIRNVGVTFVLAIGTLHMWGHPQPKQPEKPVIEFTINSHKLTPNEAKEWNGSIWIHPPEKPGTEDKESGESD